MSTACEMAELGADGRCRNCGKRARFEAAFGKVVHVRGRVKGQVYKLGRWKGGVAPAAAPSSATLPVRSSQAPRARLRLTCPDCGAALQELNAGVWRCPWTRERRQVFVDGVVACGWPRGEKPAEVA